MLLKCVLISSAILVIHQVEGRQEDVVEWKEYINGVIPDDSIPVGSNSPNDISLFIGLVHVSSTEEYSGGLIPTYIVAGETYVNVTLDDKTVIQASDNIKILCGKGDYLNRVRWHEAGPRNFMQLFDSEKSRPIRAGWQVGENINQVPFNSSLFIGRGINGIYGVFWLGKIYTANSNIKKNTALWAHSWYMGVTEFYRFDVLTYLF